MGRPTELTREYLESIGVTNITLDGKVFINGFERTVTVINKKTRYKTSTYHGFTVYDKNIYSTQKITSAKHLNGQRMVVLSRAIWAWNYDGTNANTNGHYCAPFTAPANLDIDHINDDSLDDRLDNYQLMTRQENLAKRKGHRNQYEKSLVK